jgi:hypothetical protein
MPPTGFEQAIPARERPQTLDFNRAVAVIGLPIDYSRIYQEFEWKHWYSDGETISKLAWID